MENTENWRKFLLALEIGQGDDLLPLREKDIAELQEALNRLKESYPVSARALELRYGLSGEPPCTLETLGQKMKFTRERASQICHKAQWQLKKGEGEFLKKFLRSFSEELLEENTKLKVRLTEIEDGMSNILSETAKKCAKLFKHPIWYLNSNLGKPIDELYLSVRTANALQLTKIKTVRELVQNSECDLLKIKNFGRKSLREIKELLAEMGLSLNMRIKND